MHNISYSGTLPGTTSRPIHDPPTRLNLPAVTQLLNSGYQGAAGGAAPAAEAPMFPQFPGYKPSGRVISTRVLGTNHMGGGMPGAYNMAPQQPQYHQYPQYPHMAPPAQHDPPVHQGPYGPPYGPPHADSEECAIQMEHFAQQRDETEVAMSQRQDVAPPEYRGFNFVPRTSEGSTSHTSCPYYGFHDLPPGAPHMLTMSPHTTCVLICSQHVSSHAHVDYSLHTTQLPPSLTPSLPPSQGYSAHPHDLPPHILTTSLRTSSRPPSS